MKNENIPVEFVRLSSLAHSLINRDLFKHFDSSSNKVDQSLHRTKYNNTFISTLINSFCPTDLAYTARPILCSHKLFLGKFHNFFLRVYLDTPNRIIFPFRKNKIQRDGFTYPTPFLNLKIIPFKF